MRRYSNLPALVEVKERELDTQGLPFFIPGQREEKE
jgi:hypothetical protein